MKRSTSSKTLRFPPSRVDDWRPGPVTVLTSAGKPRRGHQYRYAIVFFNVLWWLGIAFFAVRVAIHLLNH